MARIDPTLIAIQDQLNADLAAIGRMTDDEVFERLGVGPDVAVVELARRLIALEARLLAMGSIFSVAGH